MNRIYPIFVPHLGCPHQCVFCDQHTISGSAAFHRHRAERELASMLSGDGNTGGEIAFFGGSFTAIDRRLMISLLDLAKGYVEDGRACGIRFSTRPDAISEEILSILSAYPVKTIELGVQSLSDEVLSVCQRGHSASEAIEACRAIKRAGYALIGQMMTALPHSTPEDERMTAKRLIELSVDGARIYPTVVFPHTPLYAMMERGEYHPISLDESVNRCADLLAIFRASDIPVIRIGLCSGEGVRDEGIGFHGAMGELVRGELLHRSTRAQIEEHLARHSAKALALHVHPGCASMAAGHGGVNRKRLERDFDLRLKIVKDAAIPPDSVVLSDDMG